MILLIQQYSLNVSENAFKFNHNKPVWMTDGDRQSGDGSGGGLSISFPFFFLSQINGSQITLSISPS